MESESTEPMLKYAKFYSSKIESSENSQGRTSIRPLLGLGLGLGYKTAPCLALFHPNPHPNPCLALFASISTFTPHNHSYPS